MVFFVKTTLMIEDGLYRELVSESVSRFGNAKSISKMVNQLLKSHFESKGKKSMFGCMPSISYDGMRDKRDRV